MKARLFFVFLSVVVLSCSNKKQFPEKVAARTSFNTSVSDLTASELGIKALCAFVERYDNKESSFDLDVFEKDWNTVLSKKEVELKNDDDIRLWIEITGLLLELTQKEKYAAELERLSINGSFSNAINPFVITKNTDHLFVNLFENTEQNYSHTLGGEVSFIQETNYPVTGKVNLHFGMTIKRYIELYIRIPEWAEGATVTVKQVKYFAEPGSYCKIAKKWKEGDLVEIELPINQFPGHAKLVSATVSK